MSRLPPLNPLRTFEAAARHGSFTRAAEELHVTPAAVSRQVKLLEEYLGVELFERDATGVHLLAEARTFATGLGRAFRQIASATDEFRSSTSSSILTLRGYSTFLFKWLVPRLPAFQALHPQIRVRMIGGSLATETTRTEADVFIRYGDGKWPGVQVLHLFSDELLPFTSPTLARGPLDAAHIAALPLLMLRSRQSDWREWLAVAGYGGAVPAATAFEDLAVVFEFARQGLGVALAQRAYLDDELRSGALVLLSDIALRRPTGYCALCTPEAAARPKVRAFLDWLATQATPRAAAPD